MVPGPADGAVVNLSTVYRDLPLPDRAAAARSDGWERVESWWDFDHATPPADDVEAFASSIDSAGLELVAINSHGGDRAAGERGLASLPYRVDEFRASIDGLRVLADRLGVRTFNVAAGNRDLRYTTREQRDTAIANYRWCVDVVGSFGGTVLIEALSVDGDPDYPFRTGDDVVEFLSEADLTDRGIGFLFDTYHLASNGVDLVAAWQSLAPHVRHLQLADVPGRGEPGSGTLDFDAFLGEVRASGYTGAISLEYMRASV
ncbi:hypothetical protein BJK06_04670 [Curtobacterium sp. BH-2-1-1]|nr:hypothetical protein BJK06_04670 [Curtobacterium sp. BH-2-1-1]